jgi:DNA polymerase-1
MISKQLVTLKNDVPLKNDAADFIIKDINKDKLYDFLRDMEFNRLLSQAISFYGEPTNKDFNEKTLVKKNNKINTKTYKTISKEKQLDELIKKLDEKSVIAVDTETSSLNPQEADLVGVSVCYEANEAFYIPVGHKERTELKKDVVLKKLKPILEDPSIKKVGQNIKYDFIIFKNNGIELSSVEDTMLLSYTLDAGNNRHNMDTLSELHLGHKTISYKDLVGTGKKQLNFADVDIKPATEYAAEDADITLRLYEVLSERVSEEKLERVYEEFEKPMIKILSRLEMNGIKVDDAYLKKLSKKFEERLITIEKEIYKISGKKFNIGSPKQLGEIIYNDLKDS